MAHSYCKILYSFHNKLFSFQPKDIDAVESQRLERVQAAKRIKRSRSAPNSGRSSSVSDSSRAGKGGEGGGGDDTDITKSTCLPNIFKMQKQGDKHSRKDHQHSNKTSSQQKENTTILPSQVSSPDSNPPSYNDTICASGGNNKTCDTVVLIGYNTHTNANKCQPNNDESLELRDEPNTPLLQHQQLLS